MNSRSKRYNHPKDASAVSRKHKLVDFSSLYEEMPALCIILDEHLRIQKINSFGCQQLGYEPFELIDEPIAQLCAPNEEDFLVRKLNECLAGESVELHRLEVMIRRKSGSQYWVRNTVRVIRSDEAAPVILIVSEDITETRYLINELERQNAIDVLTGLCSRRRFDRELAQVILTAKVKTSEHVLCFIDLDQFKVVNDSCGHQAGDELLRNIGLSLQKNIRENDVLARLGGDEFGLILSACSVEDAELICEKILSVLAKIRFSWDGEIFTVGASIGLLPIDSTSGNASELLRQVDSACYMAKDKGRNRIQVYSPDDAETRHRGQLMRWLSRLHWAFDHDSFELHIQSINAIQPNGEQVRYYELLVRMRDFDGNLILPGAFIPAAEYYGLSSTLDSWVTRKSLDLARQMQAQNNDAHVSNTMYFINLSGLTLGDKRFVDDITALLKEQGELDFKICFEITETAAIQNLSSATVFIEHFRALGCLFALDDFGSGFSSFAYLKSLPVDFIKIDGEFVKNICDGVTELAVVKAIHEVAGAYGKRTIAEHIETQEILEEVIKLGVDFAQGFLMDKPTQMLPETKI